MRDTMKMLSLGALAAMTLSVAATNDGLGEPGPPRKDRHGKRLKVEPTRHTISKSKSASLQKLLRK